MNLRRTSLGLSAIALASCFGASASWAGDPATQLAQALHPGQGRVQGILNFYCGTVPAGKAYRVKPHDSDDLSVATANAFAEGLRGRSYPLDPSGGYEITLRARFEEGRYEDVQGNLGSVAVGTSGGSGFEVNVWSTTKDSLLTGRRSGTAIKEAPQLRIRVTLRDVTTGRVQWRGEASGILGNVDDEVAGRALGAALADAFGCAVLVENIPLADG